MEKPRWWCGHVQLDFRIISMPIELNDSIAPSKIDCDVPRKAYRSYIDKRAIYIQPK